VIREPSVFLFDEPFSNLDAALRIRMRSEVRQLHDRLGVTSVFVTHDQEEAMSISDRIAVMRLGKVEQLGTPEAVYATPISKYVAQFVGSPRMNILEGELLRNGSETIFRFDSIVLPVSAQAAATVAAYAARIDLGIRPEHVRIGSGGLPAVVRAVQPIGPETHVTVGWDDSAQTLTARVPGIVRFHPGERVDVGFDPTFILFFDPQTGIRVTGA
jgi:ABC-type sugar transport system ATPase subunit